MSAAELVPRFEPPGTGAWTLDTVHFPRPVTRFVAELFPAPAAEGFRAATAGCGLLMDRIEWAFVARWAYLCPRPVVALDEELDRAGWEALLATDRALAARLACSERALEQRRWRGEVARWEGEVKPRLLAAHRALAAKRLERADAAALRSHLQACRENLRRSIYEHHRLNVAPVLPAGELLAQAREWTGRPLGELVPLLGGARSAPFGGAAAELGRLAAALREDREASAALDSDAPADEVLERVAARPGESGRALVACRRLAGCLSAGGCFDVAEPCLDELPAVLLGVLRTALAGGATSSERDPALELLEALPAARRKAFCELLAEARAAHRVRDERALYCDLWAYGLCRRAILATGLALARVGAVACPPHLVEAGFGEICALLEGARQPGADELAARVEQRRRADERDAPPTLGERPRRPVPLEWLAPGAARTEQAFRTYLAAMSGEEPGASGPALRGIAASPGVRRGRARVLRDGRDLDRVREGDVLVAAATTPALGHLLPLVGAIVTDRGGVLSHAAIVARELGIPAVVGTGEATARIADGALVLVDGGVGKVTLLDVRAQPAHSVHGSR
jgi:phosphohistidine swiveling domain-containing protein